MRLNATTVQNVVTYNTVIDFSNPEEKLLPGETAYVTIPTGHAANSLEIPNAALSFKPDVERQQLQALYKQYNISREASTTHLGGWQVVWKLSADDKQLTPIAVQCGITDYNYTQVLRGELAEGDVLGDRAAGRRGHNHDGRSSSGRIPRAEIASAVNFREVIRVYGSCEPWLAIRCARSSPCSGSLSAWGR